MMTKLLVNSRKQRVQAVCRKESGAEDSIQLMVSIVKNNIVNIQKKTIVKFLALVVFLESTANK